MQFKSSFEKDKLSILKLECFGARTEDERQCKSLFEVGCKPAETIKSLDSGNSIWL